MDSNAGPDFIREYQKRFEKKIHENEIEVVQHWKDKVDTLLKMKPEGIASLQLELKRISSMMATRIETLKKGLR
ncbi:MAG: hypothetical protein NT072_00585 [Deltaproteobacteria bacterium]|nr:hypothetical protein [Deltaproteobacteria bacterium]